MGKFGRKIIRFGVGKSGNKIVWKVPKYFKSWQSLNFLNAKGDKRRSTVEINRKIKFF